MNDAETGREKGGRGERWGFLEDMESVGRLDLVLGDREETASEPAEDAPPPEEDRPQEKS